MYINALASCCGVSEIEDLSSHDDATSAMKAFCKIVFPSKGRFGSAKPLNDVNAFYVFTAAVVEDGERYSYGHDFAKLIRKHKLGDLVETVEAENRIYHPEHIIKVWVWHPHLDNLVKWWITNK